MGHRQHLVLAALSMGFLVVVFDASALSVAFAPMQLDLGASLSSIEWVANSYMLCFAGFLLTAGKLADRLGPKLTLTVGTVGFGVLSVACGLAPDIGLLIAGRFGQGVFAAVMVTSSYALIARHFPVPALRARAIATLNFCGSVGLSSGPVLGGVLVEHAGWRWIFFPNIAIALLIVLALRSVRGTHGVHGQAAPGESKADRGLSLDLTGQVLGVVTLGSLAVCLIEGPSIGWRAPIVIISALVFVVAAVGFVRQERRCADPMLPLALFKARSLNVGTVSIAIWRFSLYGMMFLLGLYFQRVLGYSSLQAGVAFLPLTIAPLVSNALSAPCITRLGARIAMVTGFAFSLAGAAMLSIVDQPTSYWHIGAALALIGFGGGLAIPAVGHTFLADVPIRDVGVAAGVFNAGGQTGALLGVATLGPLAAWSGSGGLNVAALVLSVLFIVAIVLAAGHREGPETQGTIGPSETKVGGQLRRDE